MVVNNLDKYIAPSSLTHTIQKEPYYGSIIAEKEPFGNLSRLQRNISSLNNRSEKELKWLIDKLCDSFHLSSSIRLDSHRIGLNLLHAFKHNQEKLNRAAIATYSVVTAARFHGLSIAPHYKSIKTYLQSIGFKVKTRDIFRVISAAKGIGLIEIKNDFDKMIIEIISTIIRNNNRLRRLKSEDRINFINNLKGISFRIFNDLKKNHYNFRSKNPMICIASVIYAASREAALILNIKNPITQKELAEYIGYAEYSVRETYEELFGKVSNF
ncbi:MAG: hypothetical protein QXR44_00920 [Thermoproteota archaeon]